MTDDEKHAIADVQSAVHALNEELSKLAKMGIEADISSRDRSIVGHLAPTRLVTIHMTRTKTEIDERA